MTVDLPQRGQNCGRFDVAQGEPKKHPPKSYTGAAEGCALPASPTTRTARIAAAHPHHCSPEPIPNYVPKRLKSILPVYLLTFSISSAEIPDAKLINAELPLPGDLRT